MVSREAILDVLRTINDPEMPISIVDLGIVEDVRADETGRVTVELLPTFVGCLAMPMIEDDVRRRVAAMPGVSAVEVRSRFDPPWTVDRVSATGRETLRRVGITVPNKDNDNPLCPYCGSADVHLESSFGPTRCKMIYHCATCRSPFEHLKRLRASTNLLQLGPTLRGGHGTSW
jgi:ring-1,2-phenylacetyl-CoA epoxidase subunit PaaD